MTIFIYAYFSPTNTGACLVGLVPDSDYSQATPIILWEWTCSRGIWRVCGSPLGMGGSPGGLRDAGFLGEGRETETQRDSDGGTEQVKRKTMTKIRGQRESRRERKERRVHRKMDTERLTPGTLEKAMVGAMTEVAMQKDTETRRGEDKRCDRGEGQRGEAGAREREEKTPHGERSDDRGADREGRGQKHAQRGEEREEDQETQTESRGGCGEPAPTPPGRRWRTPGRGEKRSPRSADRQTDKAGRSRAGPGRGRGRGSPARRGKEGPGGRREGEGSGGAGRARGAGRKRGGAAGRGPPEKRPNFLPRQSQEAGAGTQGPGSPSPTSGAPPVTSPRGLQVHCPWPRPASRPSAAGGSEEEEGEGGGAAGGAGASEPAAAPPRASVFPSVKGGKERRTNTCRVPSKWG